MLLKNIPTIKNEQLLASWNGGEDAAIWKIDEKRIGILTVDFITPVVDSPKKFGEIAAANALSDIYAMDGKPLIALNVVAFPTLCEPIAVLKEILLGGAEKAMEAGVILAGGHSVQDEEPKYGMVVFGETESDKIWRVGTARTGDDLILTKPVGIGIAVTALKAGLLSDENTRKAEESMSRLNAVPPLLSDCLKKAVTACTDLTGFGIAGHALDLPAAGVSVELDMSAVPLLPGVWEMANMGLIPEGSYNNKKYFGSKVINNSYMGTFAEDLAFDPQTSGGLLIAIPSPYTNELLALLKSNGFESSAIVGRFTNGDGTLTLV